MVETLLINPKTRPLWFLYVSFQSQEGWTLPLNLGRQPEGVDMRAGAENTARLSDKVQTTGSGAAVRSQTTLKFKFIKSDKVPTKGLCQPERQLTNPQMQRETSRI